MINENVAVLVVDDNKDFAKICAETIESKCCVKTVYATTADEAKNIVKSHSIKVVVLDQIMPTKGMDLYHDIKAIDNRIKTILITSEMQNPDILNAINIGFDFGLMKIEASNKLPSMILSLLLKYDTEQSKFSKIPFHTEQKGGFLKKFNVTYSFLHMEIINKNYFFEDEWISRNFIEKGGEVELSEEVNFESDFNFSDSIHIENSYGVDGLINFGLDSNLSAEFKNSFLLQVEKMFNYKYTENIKKVFKKKWSISLPSDSEKIVSRIYEYTKVYWQVKLYINCHCSCCDTNTTIIKNIFVPIPSVKYRIKEYIDSENENCRIIDSGEYVSEYHPKMFSFK